MLPFHTKHCKVKNGLGMWIRHTCNLMLLRSKSELEPFSFQLKKRLCACTITFVLVIADAETESKPTALLLRSRKSIVYIDMLM